MGDINVNDFLFSEGMVLYPESFPLDHEFIEVETRNSFFAMDFVAHNNADFDVDFEDALVNFLNNSTLVDGIGNVYTLSVDVSGNIFLKKVKEEEDTIAITVQTYLIYLKEFKLKLSKVHYYMNYSAKIHKEAVQDAVDIVQSKRLDNIETKNEEVDVSGILTVAISLAFFEFGVGVAMMRFMESKFASSVFMRTLMNSFFLMIGKKANNSQITSTVKALEEKINTLSLAGKTLAKTGKKSNEPRALLKKLQLKRQLIKNNTAVEEAAKALSAEKARYNDELLKLGKETVKNAVETNKGNIRDLSEPIGQEVLKNSILQEDEPEVSSLDVYFKATIQNFYETPLLVIDKMKMLVDELIFNCESFGIETEEALGFHQTFLNNHSLMAIEESIEAYEAIFNDENFSFSGAKFNQTKEYELALWVLLLKNKIVAEVNPATFADLDPYSPGPPNGADIPITIQTLKVEDNLPLYLSKRFGLSPKKPELATAIGKIHQNITAKVEDVNHQLKVGQESGYEIKLTPYSRSPIP